MSENNNDAVNESKARFLIENDYYEREYSDLSYRTSEYPFFDSKLNKSYKIVPLAVSDDKYAELVRQRNRSASPENASENADNSGYTIGGIITVIGWLTFLAAFILGIVLGRVPDTEHSYYSMKTVFSFPLALAYWCGGFVFGMLLIGFGKALQLLQDIKNKK